MDNKQNIKSARSQGFGFVAMGALWSVLFCLSSLGVDAAIRTPLLFGWMSCFTMSVGVALLKGSPKPSDLPP